MESIDPVWLFGGIALVAGALFGVMLNRLLNPAASDVDKLQAELEQARNDMESYKTSVNSHFNKTSDLVNDLTQDYVKVYRHLAEGAQTLSDTREFTQVLEQPQGRVLITVEAQADEVQDPPAAEAGQAPDPVAEEAPGAGSGAAAESQTAAADDIPAAPTDYPRANEKDTASAATLSADSESVEDKTDDENAAAVSADEVTASEADSASKAESEQQAVAQESETEPGRKT